MNPVEKIEAAIEKLQTLRKFSVPGIWGHWPEAGHVELFASNDGEPDGGNFQVVAGSVKPLDGFGNSIYRRDFEPNAELIVTLHRTIDAQLDFLRSNIEAVAEGSGADEPAAAQQALALAKAILGGAVQS